MNIKLNEIKKRICISCELNCSDSPLLLCSIRCQYSIWPADGDQNQQLHKTATQLKESSEAGCESEHAPFLIFNKSSRQRKMANLCYRMTSPPGPPFELGYRAKFKRGPVNVWGTYVNKKVCVFSTERYTSVHRWAKMDTDYTVTQTVCMWLDRQSEKRGQIYRMTGATGQIKTKSGRNRPRARAAGEASHPGARTVSLKVRKSLKVSRPPFTGSLRPVPAGSGRTCCFAAVTWKWLMDPPVNKKEAEELSAHTQKRGRWLPFDYNGSGAIVPNTKAVLSFN